MFHALPDRNLPAHLAALSEDEATEPLAALLEGQPLDDQARVLVEHALAQVREARKTILSQQMRIAHLETLSNTDELTGLLNRRGFTDALERAIANARRHDEAGLLAVIDLDGFKPVNDTYGHAAGDALLRHVAATLHGHVRTTDYLARLGGDEFAILMVNADLGPARKRALDMRARLDDAVATVGEKKLKVQASIGLAPYDANIAAEQVLHMADMAMYHDKRRRNAPAPCRRAAGGAR